MATKYQFKATTEERRMRTFSTELKQKLVREIEQKKNTIAQISRQYEVRENTVLKWIKKYGMDKKPNVRTIVELESDTSKMLAMQKKIAELEQMVGQKQIEIEFQNKMIELAELEYKIDIKKKLKSKP
jgi:transposase-like protein